MSNSAMDVHYSSSRHDWSTPDDFFALLDREFHFTLDPCATPDNAKCAKFYTPDDDGLSRDWTGERVFMNPPYGSEIIRWVYKAAQSSIADADNGAGAAIIVALLPARVDTAWFHDWVLPFAAEIRFIRGRLRFGGQESCAPFPSIVVVYRCGG